MSDNRKVIRRRFFTLAWLLIPVALLYFHYGPGQKLLAYDRASRCVKRAEQLEVKARSDFAAESWRKVAEEYQKAYELIPEGSTLLSQRVGLSVANARMYQGELFEAMQQLDKLMEDAVESKAPDEFRNQVRETLARCQFGTAWVMRLEGAESEEWLAQAEKARQNFRVLAEDSLESKRDADPQGFEDTPLNKELEATDAVSHQKNLESTIRMEQLDASVIKGLPLPKEARNCNGGNLSDKMRKSDKEGKKKGEGIGKTKEGDVRQKGAGEGERPKMIGS